MNRQSPNALPTTPCSPPQLGRGILGLSDARRWLLVGLLGFAALINYLDRATLSVSLPLIAIDLSLNPTAKGLVLSAFFWSYALLQVPVGLLADRWSLRWLYAGAFALWSVACGLTGAVGGLAALIGVRIVLGVGESVYLPISVKLLSTLFPSRDRGLPTGVLDSGTRLGLALGAPLVAWLTVRYGWRTMFFLVGFLALAWLLPWLLAFPSPFPNPAVASPAQERAVQRPSSWQLTMDRNLLGCCLGFFCYGYYQYLLVTWLPDYFVHVRHFTLLEAGAYASLTYLVWSISAPLAGWISDRLIRRGWNETRVRKGVLSVAFCTGLFLIPAALVGKAASAVPLVTAASLVGGSTANLLVIFQCCAPRGQVGAWMGMGNFIGNLGGVLSPLLTGILISRTGSYFPGFALAPLVLIAGLLSFWFIVGELKPLEQPLS
ncbi:MAG TPA: MFS transporter [Terriglobia bacterium]|nr:MFS transporter [Terriglobia bacterium]